MSDLLPSSESVALLVAQFETELAAATSARDAQSVRDRYLGRKNSIVSSWMQMISAAPPDQKKSIGRLANDLKQAIEARWAQHAEPMRDAAPAGGIDITLPGRRPTLGHRHPLTIVRDELEATFARMGFTVVEGPEAEDDWHCFDALNMPPDHPARDMQDTFYLSEDTLLRTHTSPVQIRALRAAKGALPVKTITPGRVYRRDVPDASHSPVFHQVEGLAVDRHITMADLKGTLALFAREMFGPGSTIRFRPSFFPFTEPSAEVDVHCFMCGGTGCRACGDGWLEILGCGMVHPQVLRNGGYDPEEVTGWAFGMGIERIAMLKYGVDDLRLFFDNDLRFLRQFA